MLSVGIAFTRSLISVVSLSAAAESLSSMGITLFTCMAFSVMVPVLSTHSTLTRASVSMHFMSWTRTFLDESRTTLTASATLARRYSPSGIMPMTAATMETMLLVKAASAKKNCCTKSRTPMGMIRIPTTPTSLSRMRSISDCSSWFMAFASSVSLEI